MKQTFLQSLVHYSNHYDGSSQVAAYNLTIGERQLVFQPFFRLSTSFSKVLASSQIIDGGEVFERMSVKSPVIRFDGDVYVDRDTSAMESVEITLRERVVGNDTARQSEAAQTRDANLLEAMRIFKNEVFEVNGVVDVTNPVLSALGIEKLLVESMTIEPLMGIKGFKYTIKAYDVTLTKEQQLASLIIAE